MKLDSLDLSMLKKQLKDVQKKEMEFKLSERSIVDILFKISERKKITFNYTQNGKEYVTNDKITKEIQDCIKINGGLISKINLTKIIDVNQNVIETQLDRLMTIVGVNGINIIEGKVVTNYFLNNVCNEIENILHTEGVISLSDLTNKFDFSIKFMSKFLEQKINQNKIDAILFPTRIITKDYLKVQKSLIKPILIGSLEPIALNSISGKFDIEEYLVKDLVEELLIEKYVNGKIINGLYVPDIYSNLQINYLRSNLSKNGWVEYSNLENIGISLSEAKSFIISIICKEFKTFSESNKKGKKNNNSLEELENNAEGMFLNSIYIDESLKIRFESNFYENVFNGKITNVNQQLQIPIQFEDEEIIVILKHLKFDLEKVIILTANIIPKAFIDNLINNDLIQKIITEEFNITLKQFSQKFKEFRDKEQKKKVDESKDKKSKKKDNSNAVFTYKYSCQNCLSEISKIVRSMIRENNNLLENNEKFEKALINYIIDIIDRKVVDKCFNEVESENMIKENTPNTNKSFSKDFPNDNIDYQQPEHLYYELKIILKSLSLIEKTDLSNNLNTFQTYYSKNYLTNFLKVLYQKEIQHMKLKVSEENINQFANSNKRQELIKIILDTEIKSIFSSLNENLKNINQFISIFEAKYKNLSISLLINDKKKEKICLDKLYTKHIKLYEEFKKDIGKSPKKQDYIQSYITYILVSQLKENIYLPLPFENWSINLSLQIFLIQLKTKFQEKITTIEEISSLLLIEKEFDSSIVDKLANLFNNLDK